MKPRERKLKKFEDELIANRGNQTRAYLATHPDASLKTARANASQLVKRNPQILINISERLDGKGVSEDVLCAKLKKLINAKKTIVVNGETMRINDNAIQSDNLKTAFKLHGHLSSAPTVNINSGNQQLNIGGDSLDHRQLKALTHKITELNKALNFSEEEAQDGEVVDADFSVGDASVGMSDEDVAGIVEGE